VFTFFWMRSFWTPARDWTSADLWADLTLTQNLFERKNVIGTLWTLPLEVQMYLFLPLLFLFCRRRSTVRSLAILALSIPLALLQPKLSGRLDVFQYAPCFIAGVMAWQLARNVDARRIPAWLWPLTIPVAAIIWMIAPRDHDMLYRWAFAVTLGLLIPWFRDLSWKPLNVASQLVAKYSYGIYLSHAVILFFEYYVRKYHPSVPGSIRWMTCGFLFTAVPVALYHCIELPFIQLGRRLSDLYVNGIARESKLPAVTAQ
jgi:peptidoglycan/LPS O-acetylase OafA/YrhL